MFQTFIDENLTKACWKKLKKAHGLKFYLMNITFFLIFTLYSKIPMKFQHFWLKLILIKFGKILEK